MLNEILYFIVGGKPNPDAKSPDFTKKELKQFMLWSVIAALGSFFVGMFFVTIVAAFAVLYFTYKLIAKAFGF